MNQSGKPTQTVPPPTVRRLFGLMGGAVMIFGGVIVAFFGTADLVLRHVPGATSMTGEAAVLAIVGALLFVFVYPREHERRDRPVARAIPLVLLARFDGRHLGPQGKCAFPHGSHPGPVGPNAPVRHAELGGMSHVRPRVASLRNVPGASVRHR
ncbi:MAG: hypothetical protein WCB19_08660 [Thermoplasmata archaeon]